VSPNAADAASRCVPRSTGSCAPEKPESPIAAKLLLGMALPSTVSDPVAAFGTITFT